MKGVRRRGCPPSNQQRRPSPPRPPPPPNPEIRRKTRALLSSRACTRLPTAAPEQTTARWKGGVTGGLAPACYNRARVVIQEMGWGKGCQESSACRWNREPSAKCIWCSALRKLHELLKCNGYIKTKLCLKREWVGNLPDMVYSAFKHHSGSHAMLSLLGVYQILLIQATC